MAAIFLVSRAALRGIGNRERMGFIVMLSLLVPENFSLMAQVGGTGGIMAFLPLVIIMGIFYVLLILPAQRRQKKTQEMINALKNGDKVITTGGLYGTIVGIENDAIQLRIADQVKVKVLRSAVTGLQPDVKEES
jgi:preprotein translocase subunit YajC